MAATLPEAIKLVRDDLGHDAVILNTKPIETKGILPFFKKKKVEVIAALDEAPRSRIPMPAKVHPAVSKEEPDARVREQRMNEFPATNSQHNLYREIQELKELVHHFTQQASDTKLNPFPEVFQPVIAKLSQQGVKIDYQKLADHVFSHYYQKNGQLSETEAQHVITDFLLGELQAIPLNRNRHSKKYFCLIGPTGVGKTTTLVKIAAYFALELHERIAFITIDTYRIGAVEQLKTYGKILNAPVYVCYEKSDFEAALNKLQDYDRIFIDTVGRNFLDTENVKSLTQWIDFRDQLETYFVLSLTMKEEDAREVYQQFDHFPFDGFIFTKMDETKTYGTLYNLPVAYQKGVAYITTGQEVPDDIVEADPSYIVQQIVGAGTDG